MAPAQRVPVGARRRVAIVAGDAGRLLALREPLLRALVERGHKILCLTGRAADTDAAAYSALGVELGVFPQKDERISTLGDRAAVANLTRSLGDWKPAVVLGIGLKPGLLAARAARRVGGARVVVIPTSLAGVAGPGSDRPGMALRWRVRRDLNSVDALVLYYPEQEALLRGLELLGPGPAVHLVAGPGVDLQRFAPRPMPPIGSGLVFTMICTRSSESGVFEYCEAARRVKLKSPDVRFLLALRSEYRQAWLPALDLRQYQDCIVEVDAGGDVRELLAGCHVLVAPGHTGGFAQGVAQAMASGRPAIMARVEGCRDLVDERVSGVMVEPGDAVGLAAALESFLKRPGQVEWMG